MVHTPLTFPPLPPSPPPPPPPPHHPLLSLTGVTSKLDYLQYLNVGAVWLSPFFKSPMRDFGYDVSDFRDVDPIFGTLDDFDDLIQQAHERG